MTLVASGSGAMSWIVDHLPQIAGAEAALTQTITLAIAFAALTTKLASWVDAAVRDRRAKAWRKRMNRREPIEDHLPWEDE